MKRTRHKLFTKMPRHSGIFKYTLVSFLAFIAAVVARKASDLIVVPAILEGFFNPENLFIAYTIESTILYSASAFSIILVYSLFHNMSIYRFMPYVWGLGLIGFLMITKEMAEVIGPLYASNGLVWVDLSLSLISVTIIYFISNAAFLGRHYRQG